MIQEEIRENLNLIKKQLDIINKKYNPEDYQLLFNNQLFFEYLTMFDHYNYDMETHFDNIEIKKTNKIEYYKFIKVNNIEEELSIDRKSVV